MKDNEMILNYTGRETTDEETSLGVTTNFGLEWQSRVHELLRFQSIEEVNVNVMRKRAIELTKLAKVAPQGSMVMIGGFAPFTPILASHLIQGGYLPVYNFSQWVIQRTEKGDKEVYRHEGFIGHVAF